VEALGLCVKAGFGDVIGKEQVRWLASASFVF
jgi:hypothetical protein